MTKREAVETILAGRRAASRTGREFVIDRDKLGRIGGFSSREMDRIEAVIASIERHTEAELASADHG